jgi:hypothetical protein
MQDMKMKLYGGPTTPAKSVEDLGAAYFSSRGGSVTSSRSDNESKYWVGNNSLSDDKSTAGGSVTPLPTLTNLVTNPVPGFLADWITNDGSMWALSYASNEVLVNRQAGATPDFAASLAGLGIAPMNPVLASGVKYQRAVEVWTDLPNAVIAASSGYSAGPTLTQNTWTRIVEQIVGAGAAQYATMMSIVAPGMGTGIHIKFRKSQLMENTSGQTQPYFDGSTTDTAQYHYAWTGATNNSTSTATPK